MFLLNSKLIILARALNNQLVTINSSIKFGTKTHIGIGPFTIIGALVAVFHGSSRFERSVKVLFKFGQGTTHHLQSIVHLLDTVIITFAVIFIVPMKVGIRGKI